MKTGREEGSYRLVEITYPLFAVNPAYEKGTLHEKDVAWEVLCDVSTSPIDDKLTALQITLTMTLRDKSKKKIAELTVCSTYHADAGQSADVKKRLVYITINQTAAHAQGAWRVKHSNIGVGYILPQGLDHIKPDGKEIEEVVNEKWGLWSRK